AVWGGDLYVLAAGKGPTYDDSGADPKDLWKKEYMHENDREAHKRFTEPRPPGRFEIIRKPPDVLVAMMRPVYDNDHPADDLKGETWQRWRPDGDAWNAEDDGKAFRHGARAGDEGLDWLRYRHVLRNNGGRVTLITDFMGYNSNESLEW